LFSCNTYYIKEREKERKVFVVKKREKIIRIEDDQTIIFDKVIPEVSGDSYWVYHAANAQDHTVEQVEDILKKLKELEAEEKNG